MDFALTNLAATIEDYAARLLLVHERDQGQPRPGMEWTPKEILGHLIDSAANNHVRFVRAQLADDLVFPPYDQDRWIRVQGYPEESWYELVQLWRRYNLHLAHVIAHLPREALIRPRAQHNLHLIAWRPVPAEEPTTLEYLVHDYVGHMEEHLRQILGDPPSTS